MASSPPFKVYTRQGEYIASCHHAEDAACIVALRGDGATIRLDHGVTLWMEGVEGQPAAESYDFVADIVTRRAVAARRFYVDQAIQGNSRPRPQRVWRYVYGAVPSTGPAPDLEV